MFSCGTTTTKSSHDRQLTIKARMHELDTEGSLVGVRPPCVFTLLYTAREIKQVGPCPGPFCAST